MTTGRPRPLRRTVALVAVLAAVPAGAGCGAAPQQGGPLAARSASSDGPTAGDGADGADAAIGPVDVRPSAPVVQTTGSTTVGSVPRRRDSTATSEPPAVGGTTTPTSSDTTGTAARSRAGLRLAVTQDHLWIVSVDGEVLRRLETPLRVTTVAWSPDGGAMAFGGIDGDGPIQTYVVDDRGVGIRRLTGRPTGCWGASWAPDGRRVACIGQDGVWSVAADGSEERRLVLQPEVRSVTWSPIGDLVAYAGADTRIHLVRADGSGDRLMTPPDMDASEPSWRHDGRSLVFVGRQVAPSGAGLGTRAPYLWSIDQDGTNLRCLGEATLGPIAASFAPDDSSIVFSGVQGVRTIAADGTGMRQLTPPEANELYVGPAFSPDGRLVSFAAREGVVVVDLRSGTSRTVFESTSDNVATAVWSPRSG